VSGLADEASRLHAHGPARFAAKPADEKLTPAMTPMHLDDQVLPHFLRMPLSHQRRHHGCPARGLAV
jgi:hypothetical protein